VLHVENAEKPAIMPNKRQGSKKHKPYTCSKKQKYGIRNAAKTK
jgi:hypothetical protein